MDLITVPTIPIPPNKAFFHRPSLSAFNNFPFRNLPQPFRSIHIKSYPLHAKKKNSPPEPLLEPTIIEEVTMEDEDEEQLFFDDPESDALMDAEGEDMEDEFLEEEAELFFGDGAGGGGIALAGTWWDKEALRIAEEVCESFDGEFKIYAFRTLSNSTIQVRIERLTNKSGSPSMEDIEAFSKAYRSRLDEAELGKTIADNTALEVSSPGVERVVRIPEELERFKERNMYVKYESEGEPSSEGDGIFRLISYDMETKCCTWGLANVRKNREKAGKGRPLNKKQREWRLETPFDSLRLVRLHSEA